MRLPPVRRLVARVLFGYAYSLCVLSGCNCMLVVLSAWLFTHATITTTHVRTPTHPHVGARSAPRRAAGVVNLQIAAGDTVTWNWERAGGEDQWADYHNLIGETGPDGVVWGSNEVSDSAS